jgi:hypothetical protein
VAAVVVTVVIEILNKFTRLFVDAEVKTSFIVPGRLDVEEGNELFLLMLAWWNGIILEFWGQ